MTKIDCVWLGAAILTYNVCKNNPNWKLDDIYFSQQEIIKKGKEIIGDEIPNALVSQHACAYSNSSNRNNMYLVANGVKRRISYKGEFEGKLERPDFSEMKSNITLPANGEAITVDQLFRFIDDEFTPRIIKLLEEYFSKYDLVGVLDYINNYEGKLFVAVDKAGAQAAEMEQHKKLGSAARKCVKEFADEIKAIMPRYEKNDMSNWINQGQRTVGYLWAQLRKKGKENSPTSLSVFFEKMRANGGDKKFQLRISVEAQDSKCGSDQNYYDHARLLEVEKKPGLDYYMGGSLPDELNIIDKPAAEIKNIINTTKTKKVQICKVMSEDDIRSLSAYKVYQFMIQAAFELEPYYDAAVSGDIKEEAWWPTLEEYNPNISAEQYEEILSDSGKVPPEYLDTIYYLYEMGGSGTCKQIAEKYGNVFGHYNSNARTVAKIIQKETGCPIRKRDDGSDSYWTVLFVGRDADKNEPGSWVWKLREPLSVAVKNMIQKGLFKMPSKNSEIVINPNMILYGPPGTGKTYNTAIYAVAICEEKSVEEVAEEAKTNYQAVLSRYNELKAAGRIAFTTFHQSYGYEEFIEGIKPIVDESANDIGYTIESGVFKEFCEQATRPKQEEISFTGKIWNIRNRAKDKDVKADFSEYIYSNGVILVEDITDYKRQCDLLKKIENGDWVVLGRDNRLDAIGVVTDYEPTEVDYAPFHWQRKVKWLATDLNKTFSDIGKTGHAFSNFAVAKSKLKAQDFYTLLNSVETETKPYVFIIDEINRGNISKIFGELITLIEETKRKGSDEAISAILPYSGDEFSVPNNVYLLGTMNTADRSIALMDTALRRRFSFVEMMPKPELLQNVVVSQSGASVNIGEMLDTINKRIEFLFDREHTIGHAFFMKLANNPSIDVLADIFKRSVVPLLQEYFYEDYEKIQLVLGDNGKTEERFKFIKNETVTPSALFNGRTRLEKTEKYVINESAFQWIDSYIGILKVVTDNKEE